MTALLDASVGEGLLVNRRRDAEMNLTSFKRILERLMPLILSAVPSVGYCSTVKS